MKHYSKILSVPKREDPIPQTPKTDLDREIHKISTFIKTGLFTLSVITLSAVAIAQSQYKLNHSSTKVTNTSIMHPKELPIYCVDRKEKIVALSFDAAWGNEDTGKILSILKKKKVHVTFFMTGGWIEKYPDDVKAIQKAGHELGNHSENHKQMSTLSSEQCKEEIMKVHERVKKLTGTSMKVFRPPYGDYNDTLIQTVNACGYKPIQWDVDSLDWKDYGPDSILNTVLNHKHLGNGSIILCHNGAKYTAQVLEQLIDGLQKKGYRLVRMSDIIYQKNYEINTEGRQISLSATPKESAPGNTPVSSDFKTQYRFLLLLSFVVSVLMLYTLLPISGCIRSEPLCLESMYSLLQTFHSVFDNSKRAGNINTDIRCAISTILSSGCDIQAGLFSYKIT